MIAEVNLWELITAVSAAKDKNGERMRHAEKCDAIQEASRGTRFASELSLRVDRVDYGEQSMSTWTIEAFDHEDPDQKVELRISPNGHIQITRFRKTGDVSESRTLHF